MQAIFGLLGTSHVTDLAHLRRVQYRNLRNHCKVHKFCRRMSLQMETNLTELTNLGDKLPVSFSFLPDKHLKQRFWRVILFRWGSRILWAETWRQVLAFYFSSTSCRKSWSPQGGASGHIEKWKQKRRKLKLPGRSFLRRHLSEITTSVIKNPQFQMFATLWEETSCISLPSSFSLLYLVSPFIPFFPPSKKNCSGLLLPAAFLLSFVITVFLGHTHWGWPYISDTTTRWA